MSRTLLLMRHAKSGYPPGVDDHDRPLAARGEREAGLAGDLLRHRGIDAVLCSSARRTRDTLARTGIDAPVHIATRLYDAAPETVLAEIREADATFGAEVHTLLVIGHEPAMSGLTLALAAPGVSDAPAAPGVSDAAALRRVATKFPTSAIATLHVDGPWDTLGAGGAVLTSFDVPR
ncbi:histidine phosphatase family protein [Mycobacterium sp. MYCO198283]|uniref:SixA phosphatase family protein n=1 Tax=Mycobacterium sp. MYCO198283 TaxID=2883505 RepID=UPI001E2D094B|nr:histidine phosphatase family protein [Mycobacterium sp. MYCO198283]MCG5430727.1 histidine phosphatase family protein [Mycobacterium sp. MYCO198283]